MNYEKLSEIIASHFVKRRMVINTFTEHEANFIYWNYCDYNPETKIGKPDFSTCHDAKHSLLTKIHYIFLVRFEKRKFTSDYEFYVQQDEILWMKITCNKTNKSITINAI